MFLLCKCSCSISTASKVTVTQTVSKYTKVPHVPYTTTVTLPESHHQLQRRLEDNIITSGSSTVAKIRNTISGWTKIWSKELRLRLRNETDWVLPSMVVGGWPEKKPKKSSELEDGVVEEVVGAEQGVVARGVESLAPASLFASHLQT
ncbi:hypothetical protein E3N88_07216 [Mikania micrantha]|uniref:Uncharacterized protein n=1 Tax=Mikania micrantha TaxID=192012 RepID=A0A5N6PTA1_9ASTR|nr:hypothetical protein E3N88_07216 [Mikania micrantha]